MDEPKEHEKVAEERSPYGEQDAWGNDIAALRANLKLTPVERLRRAQQSLNSLQELKRALKRID